MVARVEASHYCLLTGPLFFSDKISGHKVLKMLLVTAKTELPL